MFLNRILKQVLFMFILSIMVFGCSENSTNSDTSPSIISISPNSSAIGYVVTIKGNKFGDSPGNSVVNFTGATASITDIISWSNTSIKLFVPLKTQSGKVFISNGDKKSNEVDFSIVGIGTGDPWLQYLDVVIAQVTQKIGIYGKNFGATQGTSYAEFNGTRATSFTSWTDTKIIAVVPEGATTGKVVVYVNGKSSNGLDFTVQSSNQIVTMVTIPAGSFIMGTDDQTEIDNHPTHKVTISQPFLMGKTEVTQKMWKVVMDNSNPSNPTELGDDKPVQQVTFIRAIDFCNRLSKMEQRTPCYTVNGENVTIDWTADGYRLPTEAEWEYAARAGKIGEFSLDEIIKMSWNSDNASKHISSVAQKTANSFGLYDMFGNVYEMCWDFYDADYYHLGAVTDPRGPSPSTTDRVMRGGSYINSPELCGVTIRRTYLSTNDNYNFNLGFRVVRKK